jgi:predicted MPP superfamily phosphohydrolase
MSTTNKKIVEVRRQTGLGEPQDLLDAEPQVESTSTSTNRIDVELHEGMALIFSDCHYDPEAPASTAHRACVKFSRNYRPDLLICGGDAVDWAGLSKHPRIMWEDRPSAVR